ADAVAGAEERRPGAAPRGAVLQVGHVERFNRAVRAAAPYLDEPRFLQIDRLSPFQPRGTDVAVILDLMIHDLDLVLELVRAPVADVRATGVAILTPLEHIVEHGRLEAPEAEPLKLELESFLRAVRGEEEVVVSGAAGAQALALAFRVAAAVQASPLDSPPPAHFAATRP